MKINNVFNIDTRVYIAGILIPTTHVSITSAYNTPPTATIAMPPYPQLFGIGRNDRLPVQVFMQESFVGKDDFILLFEGEVTDFSYNSTAIGREIVVNAQALVCVLRDVNIEFLTTIPGITKDNMLAGSQNDSLKINDFMFPTSLFMQGFKPVGEDTLIETPTEYLENALRLVAEKGSMGDYNNSALAGFYSKYSERIRLLDRFMPLPYFDEIGEVWSIEPESAGGFPLIDGMQKANAVNMLQNKAIMAAGNQSGPVKGSIFDMINYVVNQMEYEFAFFSSPRYDEEEDKLVTTCLKPLMYEAHPPACNIIYRSFVQSIRTQEKVYRVPTRVRTRDIHGVMSRMFQEDNIGINQVGTIDYYPSEEYESSAPSPDEEGNWFASEMLQTEEHTGPYLFDTQAPAWMSYVDENFVGSEDPKTFKDRILRHTLMLKRYEVRQMSVSTTFNPYVTPGFPAVIYDGEEAGFVFIGHVLNVAHSITKQNCSTNITLGFTRVLEEQKDNPLENTIKKIDDVTRGDVEKVSEIYQKLLGCDAVSLDDLEDLIDPEDTYAQDSPFDAYVDSRREICTLEQYMEFMGFKSEHEEFDDWEESIISEFSGDYLSERFDRRPPYQIPEFGGYYSYEGETEVEPGTGAAAAPSDLTGIRFILKQIAEREFNNKVFY